MKERAGAISSAREMAEASRARAQAATDGFEAKTRTARADRYRQLEDNRRAALDQRAAILAETRQEVEQLVGSATSRIGAQATAAQAQLERDADQFASTIVERVLGRKAS